MFHRYAGKHALTRAVKALWVRVRIGIIITAVAGLSVAGLMLPTSAPSAAASSTCVPDYAFVNDPGIALRTQCDTVQTQLTTGSDARPTLSPDGKHVAFVRVNNNATNPEDAEIMPTTGGDPVQLPDWNNVSYISWSPTGSQFVIVKNEEGVYIVNTDGTISSTILPDYSGSVNAAVWCGNKIVYDEAVGTGPINIYAANTDGTGATQLTSNGTDTWPACSPDGKWVFFTEASLTDHTLTHVSVVPVSGGTPVQLTADRVGGAGTPTVSADWTLGWSNNWTSNSSSTPGLQFMWLGGTAVVNGPQGVLYELSFASGDGSIPAPTGFPIAYNSTAPTPSPSPTPTATSPSPTPTGTASFVVQVDDSNVGKVFGSVTGKKVLDGKVLPPSQACRSGWEVTTANNTAFVLHTPTNGNVTGTRVDIGQSGSSYLFPGQTAYYCVAFNQLNQIFNVLYDISDLPARTADAAMLVIEALTPIPSDDANDLANFVSSVASIPQLQKIGACLGSLNPLCAPQAINALMTNDQSLNEVVSALVDYLKALGESVAQTALEKHLHDTKWLAKYLGEKIVKVVTTGWWVTKFTGQVILSPAGYVAFETAPSSQ